MWSAVGLPRPSMAVGVGRAGAGASAVVSVPPGTLRPMDVPFTGAVFLGMSVDGFIARPDGDLSWLTAGTEGDPPAGGAGGDFGFAAFVAGVDALLMGRSTYEFLAPMAQWPYQGKPVHVLSTT